MRTVPLLLPILFAGTALADPRVEVFTDHAHPLTHTQAFTELTVYRIDGLAHAQDQLSEGLPADEEAATEIASSRLAAHPDLKDRMMEAGQGLALAHLQYRLDRYPAIVLDGTSVIYGVTDLAVAKRLYGSRQ